MLPFMTNGFVDTRSASLGQVIMWRSKLTFVFDVDNISRRRAPWHGYVPSVLCYYVYDLFCN